MSPQLGRWEIWQLLTVVVQEEVGEKEMTRVEMDVLKVPLITLVGLVVARRRRNLSPTSSSWAVARLTNLLTGATRHSTSTNPVLTRALSLSCGPAAWKHLHLSEMWRLWTMFTGPRSHQMPRGHTLGLDRAYPKMAMVPARLPSGTVLTQVLILMGGWARGQQFRGRDKRLLGYDTSSIAAMEQVQKRGEEMEVRQQHLGGLEGATKKTREKAPTMHQLATVK